MHNFRELKIWQEGIKLAVEINQLCNDFPDYERYGLSSQMRRCSVSIPSNISEGCSRTSEKELIRFLRIALGSNYELETQLIIAKELKYIESDHSIFDFNNKVQRMIWNFITKINQEK